MPTFETPEPIIVTIDLAVGDIRLIASDRTDTIVNVSPKNGSRAADVKVAERTRVEYSDGRLLVQGPKQRFHLFRSESIDVTIELPAGSDVYGDGVMGKFSAEGRLGESRFHTDYGAIDVDQTGKLDLDTGYGNVTVNRVVGNAEIGTGSGTVRIREIDGTATIKNSNGHINIGEVAGEIRVNGANTDISIGRALTSLTVKTGHGKIRIGEVVRGSVLLETGYGGIEVGIREGTAAWLDVSTHYGKVRNSLPAHDGPRQPGETVEVRARTSYGNIMIHRSNETSRARKVKL